MNDLKEAILLLGPPKSGQVLFIDMRCLGHRVEEILSAFPDEWAGIRIQLILPPAGMTTADCVALGKMPESVL